MYIPILNTTALKKILVPVDFSKHSEYAMEVAAILAAENKSEIVVLHMLGLSEAAFPDNEAEEVAEARYFMKLAKERFSSFLDKPYLKGIKITEIVQNYKIFSEIRNVAREQGIDLIVMGSHGTGGMREIFVGSNTEKVVRGSEVPVLVIKKRMPHFRHHRIVYAMDFKTDNLKAYTQAMALFAQWKSEVHLVHVNQPNIQFLSTSQLKELSGAFFKKAHDGPFPENTRVAYVADYTVEHGLYAYAEEHKADLIAVPTHGRSGLAHFFRGSVGEDIANHSPIPVLTFHT